MPLLTEQKKHFIRLRDDLRRRLRSEVGHLEREAVVLLLPVVADLMELNDIHTRLVALFLRPRRAQKFVNATFEFLADESSFPKRSTCSSEAKHAVGRAMASSMKRVAEKAKRREKKIIGGLRVRGSRIYQCIATLGIDQDAVLMKSLANAIGPPSRPSALRPPSLKGVSQEDHAACSSQSNGAPSKPKNKTVYTYRPSDEVHEFVAKVLRNTKLTATLNEVAVEVDKTGKILIEIIAPRYCASLEHGARSSLVEAIRRKGEPRHRLQKVLNDVRSGLRKEKAQTAS